MTSDQFHKLIRVIYEIRKYIMSMHQDENHWLKLRIYSDGSFFKVDLEKHALEFSLEAGIDLEVEVRPSGRSIKDCEEVDCLTQVVSVKVWCPQYRDPHTYKWEYGTPTKLKKEDKDWYSGVSLLKGIEIILEDAVKNVL